MKIEVRCCCDARLLGHMEMPFLPADGCTSVIMGGLSFNYQHYSHQGVLRGPALKSKDYPVQDLRRIPEFTPATFEQRVRDAEELL